MTFADAGSSDATAGAATSDHSPPGDGVMAAAWGSTPADRVILVAAIAALNGTASDPAVHGDALAEFDDAIRAHVAARRVAGESPERVLRSVKEAMWGRVTPKLSEGIAEQLQAALLRGFLAGYYGAPAPQMHR